MAKQAKRQLAGSGETLPAGVIGEVITVSTPIATTNLTTSEADVTNASLVLPAGTWRIEYSVTANYTTGAVSGNAGYASVCITDNANTHIGKSERMVYVKATAAVANTVYTSLAAATVVSISSSTTYKLRGKKVDSVGTGTASVEVSAGAFDCTFFAVRIA